MMLALILLLFATLTPLFLFFLLRCTERSIDEVAPYLVMVNDYVEEIDRHLDPKWQEELRDQPEGAYRADVCRSVRVLSEFFERKRKNVRVLNEFAETEYFDLSRVSLLATARLNQLKAEYLQMQSELERWPEPADADSDGDAPFPNATRQQHRELEQAIELETIYCETTLRHLDALRAFISQSGWLLSAMNWPILKLRLCSLIPYDRWTWIREPRLASFAYSRGIHLPQLYRNTKSAALDLIALLYPCAKTIRLEIQSQM